MVYPLSRSEVSGHFNLCPRSALACLEQDHRDFGLYNIEFSCPPIQSPSKCSCHSSAIYTRMTTLADNCNDLLAFICLQGGAYSIGSYR